MGRSRGRQSLFLKEMLQVAPIWVGPILAGLAFAVTRWAVPWWFATWCPLPPAAKTIGADLAVRFAPGPAVFVLFVWAVAEIEKLSNRRRLDGQTGIESIRALPWGEFESLVTEAFRRQGFVVEQTGGPRPDGGVDQRLSKAGAVTLVQCKQWRERQVGVKIVRELLGVVTHERAQSGIVVTSGEFTAEARAFAERNPIRLIAGEELLRMIQDVQTGPRPAVAIPPTAPPPLLASSIPTVPACPQCRSPMKLQLAKHGKRAGSQFWGCSRFPDCRGTRDLAAQAQ